MRKPMVLVLMAGILVSVLQCSNPEYIIYTFSFAFHSDIDSISLDNLSIKITADVSEKLISSDEFSLCTEEYPGCESKWVDSNVPEFTINTPMTPFKGEEYFIRESDGSSNISIVFSKDDDTLFYESRSFDPIKKYDLFLICLGSTYNESHPKIRDFIIYAGSGSHNKPNHMAFPIDGTIDDSDSLYLIWVE